MNCDDFNDWLHSRLDSRTILAISHDAKTHLEQCNLCRGQLDAWKQISSILPTDDFAKAIDPVSTTQISHRRNRSRTATWALVGAAVFIGCTLTIAQTIRRANTVVVVDVSVNQDSKSSVFGETSADATPVARDNNIVVHSAELTTPTIDPSSWWQEVQGTDWIGNSMPTMQSMRDGVAPLGRSLVQAVTLLTRFGGGQTS